MYFGRTQIEAVGAQVLAYASVVALTLLLPSVFLAYLQLVHRSQKSCEDAGYSHCACKSLSREQMLAGMLYNSRFACLGFASSPSDEGELFLFSVDPVVYCNVCTVCTYSSLLSVHNVGIDRLTGCLIKK